MEFTDLGETRPLTGVRVVVTRAPSQAADFSEALEHAGAIPIHFPTIDIAPIPDNAALVAALQRLDQTDWIVFTSANGTRIVLDQMRALGLPPTELNRSRVAAIGPATAAPLADQSVRIDFEPDEHVAEAFASALAGRTALAGRRISLLQAEMARTTLREELAANGAVVDAVPVYRTVRGYPDPEAFAQVRAGADVVSFTSSSTVRYFCELLGDEAPEICARALVACIGPITAKTARELGLRVDLVAEDYSVYGLMAALTEKLRS